MNPAPVPAPDVLNGFVRGTLSDPEAERVAAWADRDPGADAILERVPANDTLLDVLATVADTPAPDDPAVEHLIRSLSQALGPLPAASAPPHSDAEGPLSFGNYRIDRPIARGGMGEVYEATDTRLGRRAAVKVIRRDLATPEARQRFLRECRLAATLDSEHVVRIYHADEVGGVLFLAMEYVDGPTLEAWLRERREPPTPAEVLWIARELLSGLVTLHQRELIHRDIKPANAMLILRDGEPHRLKLLDFGLTRPINGADQVTQPGGVTGTPAYMSPEQALVQPLTPKSDLFSVGAVLYRALTGVSPFRRGSTFETLLAVKTFDPLPLDGGPPELNEFIFRLLAKDPTERPGAADALAEAVALAERFREPPPAKPPRRTRTATWLAGLALALSVVIIIIIIRDKGSEPPHGERPEPSNETTKLIAEAGRALTSEAARRRATGGATQRVGGAAVAVGDRVRVIRETGGYADVTTTPSPFLSIVSEDTQGKVLRINSDGDLCQILAETSSGSFEVWVLVSCVSVIE